MLLICTMHSNTHSVHNYLSKSWRGRLLCPRSSCYVFPPPLSGTNCCSLPLPGGPGPPSPKVASPFPGSAHTPSHGTEQVWSRDNHNLKTELRKSRPCHCFPQLTFTSWEMEPCSTVKNTSVYTYLHTHWATLALQICAMQTEHA